MLEISVLSPKWISARFGTVSSTPVATFLGPLSLFLYNKLADYPALPGYLFIPIFYQTHTHTHTHIHFYIYG
jgi:hypothetical protein